MVGKSSKKNLAQRLSSFGIVGHSPLGPYQVSAWCARSNAEPRWGEAPAPAMKLAMIAMRRLQA